MKNELVELPKMIKVYEGALNLLSEGPHESKYFFSKEKAEEYANEMYNKLKLELSEGEYFNGVYEEGMNEEEVEEYMKMYYVNVYEYEVHP